MPHVELDLAHTKVSMAIDTGAGVNILDEATYKQLKMRPILSKSRIKLFGYGPGQIQQMGTLNGRVLYKGQYRNLNFIVTNGNNGNLLSYESAVTLGIVPRICVLKTKTDCRPSAISHNAFLIATKEDRTLQEVAKMIKQQPHEHQTTAAFNRVRQELAVTERGLILRGNRLVVPTSLQKQVVRIGHGGHMGIVQTKRLMRSHVWFPRLDEMVEEAVRSCVKCQLNTKERNPPPCIMSPMPDKMWTELSTDFYGPIRGGKYLLVVIDDASRYPIVRITSSTRATEIIPIFNNIFSEFGVPKVVRSDGGPPFNSHTFKEYMQQQGVVHRKVTPNWAQANGLVERFMPNLTKIVRSSPADDKAFREELDEYLRNYRATPHSSTQVSPNQLMFFRQAKTTRLPVFEKDETSPIIEKAREADARAKMKMKINNDLRRKVSVPSFKVGDRVYLLAEKRLKSDPVYEKDAYIIKDLNGTMATIRRGDGRQLARNVSLLKKVCQSGFWVPISMCFEQPAQPSLATCLRTPPVQEQAILADVGRGTDNVQLDRGQVPAEAEPDVNLDTGRADDLSLLYDTADDSDGADDTFRPESSESSSITEEEHDREEDGGEREHEEEGDEPEQEAQTAQEMIGGQQTRPRRSAEATRKPERYGQQ
jgi:hypothetical protein